MPRHNFIAIIMATKLEAAPFLERLSLNLETKKPILVYGHGNIVLSISGIGKANAAIATTYSILRYQPRLVCNLGAAGATRPGFGIGEIYHIDRVIEYDRPHLRSAKIRIFSPQVLPGFRYATVATQDKPVVDQDRRRAIAGITDLVDMEAAGILLASKKFDVPCVALKFVSDTVEHEDPEEIVENMKQYCNSFCDYFVRTVLPLLSESEGK